MSNVTGRSPSRTGRISLRFAVRAALGLATLVSANALAQQAEQQDTDVEEVVVTGFRGSLNQALDVKRDQVGAIDAIVAEDIADFPDLNLAESLQRIPGVSIARDAGEGRTITVRGLSPEFTRIRLNGMEAMSANGGSDQSGGTNRGRSFDFNTFASELFNSITVRKTASADIEEGSLGATVDLRTGRPFDYDGLTIVTSATAQYNDLADKVNPRGALVLSNTWGDKTFGALMSVAYTKRKLIDEGSSTVRWSRPTGAIGAANPADPANVALAGQVNTAFVPRIPRYDYYQHDQDRLGVTASLQWAPTDRTQINFDGLYAKFEAERNETYLEFPNFSTDANGMRVQNAVIDNTNTVVYGVFNNVDIRSENRHDELTTEFKQFTLDFSHSLTENITLNGLVGHSQADHDNPVQTTLLFDWNNIPQFTYDFRGDKRLPVLSVGSTNVTSTTNGTPNAGATSTVNSNGWYLSQVRIRPQQTTNEFKNYQVDADWKPTDMLSFKAGVQLKDFEFSSSDKRIDPAFCNNPALLANANAETCAAVGFRATPLNQYSRTFSYGDDLDIPAGTTTTFLIPNYSVANNLFGLKGIPLSSTPSLGNNRRVEEEDLGYFVQSQLNTDVLGRPLRGNLGVRYVKTDQTTYGFSFLSGQAVLLKVERDYTDTLPSLNVSLNLTDDFIIRAAAAKVMSRPGLGDITPGGGVSVSGANRTATLGNPNIDPTRAKAYDMSFEWYFAPESLVSLALFYKDIDSRSVQRTLTDQVFTGNPFGIPDSVAVAACGTTPGCSPALANWTFTTNVNGPGGNLKGFEISYQQPFTFLPGFLSNFGTQLNYTGVDSKIQYVGGINEDLVGLSRSAYNATLYYETEHFGARVSAAYRDNYLTQVPGRNGNDIEGTNDVLQIDASTRYTVNDNLDITLEFVNLTDEFEDQYVDSAGDRLSYYHHTGRSYLLGAKYKF